MAPVKIGASDSTETRMTERKICVFIDIFGIDYQCRSFNTCDRVEREKTRITPQYRRIYLDIALIKTITMG
jgi:hypothetical protein